MSRKHRHRRGGRHKRRTRSPREVLYLFLHQNNISARNIEHIRELTQHPDAEVKELAEVVLEIARVKPGRHRRMQVLAREHPDLFVDLVAVLDEEFWDDLFYRYGQCGWLWGQWEVVRSHVQFQ